MSDCDVIWDEESIGSACSSTSCELLVSGHSDSTFHVAYDNDEEINDSQDMNDNTTPNNKYPDHEYAHHQNMTPSHNDSGRHDQL